MVVAGIESEMTTPAPPLALPVAALGYRPDEVTYFSYGDAGGYRKSDTEGPIMAAAHRLADQLRAMERAEPGREVDLIAHSQGGVIVEAFLTQLYDRGDRTFPPLGTVVTLSSPLRGAPLAEAAAEVASTRSGDTVLRRTLPLARTPAVRDLAPESGLMQRLDRSPLPDETELTTIGAATDVIVPGTAAARPGARHATVIPRTLDAHSGVLTDPAALRDVRAALEQRPLPCATLVSTLAGAVLPALITRAEEGAGAAGAAAGTAADLGP